MPYSELITQEGEYTYSANIQFDTENDHKLLRFIPNETTTALIKEYFVDITRSNPIHHARILYGSYGTGKSHFLTVLSLLLEKKYVDSPAYESLLIKLKAYNPDLVADIETFENSVERKPFLTVPIVFDFEDFDRCIYFSLKKRLESIGISVHFKTFYDQASQLINQWKKTDDSYKRLADACSSVGIGLSALEEMLHRFDERAEEAFQAIFSEMTYGVKYVYEVSSLPDAVKQAYASISDNYSGFVFIFDEFGRYIEDNIKKVKVKSIQDLAEFCDHASGNNHIILVSHKEISQYTRRYGKSISNEWKKVEGRYTATPINDRQDQCLSLIGNILTKNPLLWTNYKKRFSKELNKMYSEAADFRGFLIDAAQNENPFEGGFPLHPISLFALDRLSKKVAQNERTFFTYLASKDKNSLYDFLESHDLHEFHYVGIDDIFNYFEPNIRAVQSEPSFEWYRSLQRALTKGGNSLKDTSPEVKILKVIATIGIINDSTVLVPDKQTILSVIDVPKEVLSNALDGLCERKIIKFSGAYNRYDFFEASIFDVEKLILDGSHSVEDKAIVEILNEYFVDFVLYPYRHNNTYKINRVFLPLFCLAGDLPHIVNTRWLGNYYDGILVLLLSDNDVDLDQLLLTSRTIDRSILLVHTDTEYMKSLVRQFISIQYLESKKESYIDKDPAFEKELQYYKDEVSALIKAEVANWRHFFNDDSVVISEGNIDKNVHSFTDLSSLASNILDNAFPQTLIVNNELINKNTVSGSIMTAKRNVLKRMLNGSSPTNYYDVQKLSPDYIAVRSVLVKNGYIKIVDEQIRENQLIDGARPQNGVFNVINNFIEVAKTATVAFSDIYVELKNPPFGLRDGYLSILLAHFLLPHKKSLIITSHGVEKELSAELFDDIIKRPHDFSFSIASWSKEQLDYFDSLAHIFADKINPVNISKNQVKAIFEGMFDHFKSTSKYARTTDSVSEYAKIYRELFSRSITNYSMFLISGLSRLGINLDDRIEVIRNVKLELDNVLQHLVEDIASHINALLKAPISAPLCKTLTENYRDSWKAKRQKSFDYFTNTFLDLVSKIDNSDSDYEIVLQLSKAITGLEIVYWNDHHRTELLDRLAEIKTKLDNYHAENGLGSSEARMTISSASGGKKDLVFDIEQLNTLSKTVKNKIMSTLGNYGMSISYEDKIQVILSVLDDLLEGK